MMSKIFLMSFASLGIMMSSNAQGMMAVGQLDTVEKLDEACEPHVGSDKQCDHCVISRMGDPKKLQNKDFKHMCLTIAKRVTDRDVPPTTFLEKYFINTGGLDADHGLDPSKYVGFSFDRSNSKAELANDKHTLITEGNATIADNTNRVHSATLDSCTFVIIHYKDDNDKDKYFMTHISEGVNSKGDVDWDKDYPQPANVTKDNSVGTKNIYDVFEAILSEKDWNKKIKTVYVLGGSNGDGSYPEDFIYKLNKKNVTVKNFPGSPLQVLFDKGKIFYAKSGTDNLTTATTWNQLN
jgi:hypothetical protein